MRSLLTLDSARLPGHDGHLIADFGNRILKSRVTRLVLAVGLTAALWSFPSLALAASAPSISSTRASDVLFTTASIRADIDPHEATTTYRFEYGPDEGYGTSVPVPGGEIASGAGEVEVGQSLTGLAVATTYHYRAVAENAEGTTVGSDHTFITYAAPTHGAAETCANASFRLGGFSARLPDCRAYEMVSPVDKNGGDIVGDGRTNVASENGDAVVFASRTGIADTEGSGGLGISQYLATRGPSAWSTHGITPRPALNAAQIFIADTFNWAFSADLHASVVEGYDLPGGQGGVPDGENIYVEDTNTNHLETITTPLGTEAIFPLALGFATRGFSSDLGVVTFQTESNLLPETAQGDPNSKLYVWSRGALNLAGILPDGSIPAGGSESPFFEGPRLTQQNTGTVSSDGSRIPFVSPADGSSAPQLYMRKSGTSTAWVSQSESTTPISEPQNVKFQAMTPDGRGVVFSTSQAILDADPGGPGQGIYLYTDSNSPATDSNLTFIARVPNRSLIVPGISQDASHIYFFGKRADDGLPSGAGLISQLYLWDQGTIHTVVASPGLSSLDKIATAPGNEEVWVSPDGRRLAIVSTEPILDKELGDGKHEVMYFYDEGVDKLRCISCAPSGAAPVFGVAISPFATDGAHPILSVPEPHALSANGRYVFFSTADALLPQDTNGLSDVYEYDADTGQLSLISPGAGDNGSWFVEANPSGSDVFFVTREPLSGWDSDSLVDLYDARIEGGLPGPPAAVVACAGDACQGVPGATPGFSTASGFSGLGNVISKPTTQSKKGSKSKKAPKRKKHKQKTSKHKKHKHKKAHGKAKSGAKAGRVNGKKSANRSSSSYVGR